MKQRQQRAQAHRQRGQSQQQQKTIEECVVCLEANPDFQSRCHHRFHRTCIDRWRDQCQQHGRPITCPSCREPLPQLASGRPLPPAQRPMTLNLARENLHPDAFRDLLGYLR
ncbi:hypothetical protein EBZ80_08840 [bacterium]|nr:hypothetical protein [bacterium]